MLEKEISKRYCFMAIRYDTIRYIYARDGLLNLAHGTETKKIRKKTNSEQLTRNGPGNSP